MIDQSTDEMSAAGPGQLLLITCAGQEAKETRSVFNTRLLADRLAPHISLSRPVSTVLQPVHELIKDEVLPQGCALHEEKLELRRV